MLWRIDGADSKTGTEVQLNIEAGSLEDVLILAKAKGIFTSKVTEISTTRVDVPYAQPIESSETINPALYIGICSLVAWIVPIIGIPTSILGLLVGLKGPKSASVSSSVIAIIVNTITLSFGIMNSIAGAIKYGR